MTLFATFRWPVKLALLIIALLAAIAMSSGWWLPYDPAAIDLHQRLLSRARPTGSVPITSAGIFSRACWPPPASRWAR